jgi:FMN-dependent NADH-azoreductase
MTLYRLDASIRIEGSHSRAAADIVEQEFRSAHPTASVLRRHVGTEPVPATTWATAVGASATPEAERTPEQVEAVDAAAAEVDPLLAADALLFAVPIYNFGVSEHFKTWVDLVITDHRLGPGAEPPLAGKPAVLVVVRGGAYGAGTPREGWDHATPWMLRILRDVWQLDVNVVEEEFTLVGVNPALDEFKELAVELRARAEASAHEHGRSLAAAATPAA